MSDPELSEEPESVVPASPRPAATEHVRPGDLVTTWRTILGLAWLGAFFSYAAVWQASVQIGIGTWWVGPRAQPTNVAVKLLPFVLALSMVLFVVYNVARVVRLSGFAVVLAAVFALPDFGRVPGLAIVEIVVAALLGIVTLCALSGRYATTEAVASDSPVDGPAVVTSETWAPPVPHPPD